MEETDEQRIADRKRIAEAFAAARKRLGMSLNEVADQLEISSSTLSRAERGVGRLDFKHEVTIKRWLGIPLSLGAEVGTADTMAGIRSALENDDTLDRAAKDALYDLMSDAYNRLTK
jgi:transcriptional regulator with XRE-family HTH domain